MKELAGHAPPRYEFQSLSLDDWIETFERGRALESTTDAQMLSLRRLHYKGYRRLPQACSPISAKEMKDMASPIPDVVAWVGLDWADQQHHGRLQAVGSSHVESFVLPQRPTGLQDWVGQLRTRFPLGHVAIALEQSRGPLVYALMNYDFLLLYPVPPKTLAEQRRKLVNDRTRLTNRLTSLLKDAFPQALEWAGELSTARACEFLRRWPSLQSLQGARRSAVRHFYLQQGWKDPTTLGQRLDQIRQAQPLTSDPAVLQVSALMVELLAQQLQALLPALERIEKAIAQLFAAHADQSLWDSFPGAGAALAPRLLAAFGTDRQRYQEAREMQQFSGIAPVTERSGKQHWVHWRWACPKFLRQTFHEYAAHSRRWSPWAQTYYQQQIEKGAGHHAAVRALAFKWIRILYRCWQDRTPYDEQRYLKALERRGSPLLKRLQSQAPLSAALGGSM